MFLLYLSSVIPEIYFGTHLYLAVFFNHGFIKTDLFFLFLACSSSHLLRLILPKSLTRQLWVLCQYFQTWFKPAISITRKMKIVNSLDEWNVIMIEWMKLDCLNKLNNISRQTFHFLNYFDTFLSKQKFQVRERKI